MNSQQQQDQQPQKKQPSFKGLLKFLQGVSPITSKDPHVREKAIEESTKELRSVGASEAWANDFHETMKNVEEAMNSWLRHSTLHKRIATGLLAINLLLFPILVTQQKFDLPLQMALIAVSAAIPLLAFYNFIMYTFEEQKVENAGCGLSVVEVIFELATAFAVAMILWHAFPPASIVFILTGFIGGLLWMVNMMRGAMTAAHWRRHPSTPTNTQQPPTK
jgi:hypothetical protein